jgi:hypothetical protein
MATTPNSVIVPQGFLFAPLSLAAVTACSTRAPTAVGSAAAANIFQVSGTITTNGCRIDKIYIKGASSAFTSATVAQTVTVWISDGTTCWPFDEILVTAVTPSTTAASYQGFNTYTNLNLPSTHSVWISTSVTTTASTTALIAEVSGATY